MKHVQFEIKEHRITIIGSNQVRDILTSARCWPKHGFHAGAYDAAQYVYSQIKDKLAKDEHYFLRGHSFGGAIAQILAVIMRDNGYIADLETIGAYPVYAGKKRFTGLNIIYGNDPVPGLFPWFRHVGIIQHIGPERKWGLNFKDHVRY